MRVNRSTKQANDTICVLFNMVFPTCLRMRDRALGKRITRTSIPSVSIPDVKFRIS